MATFYTRKGDEGFTDLFGERVAKHDPRTETIGTLDEASAQIGLARASTDSQRTNDLLVDAQRDLYVMMAELAFTAEIAQNRWEITAEFVERIERATDELTGEFEIPPHFIIPGDTLAGAALDVARTVVRRAERRAVRLAHEGQIDNADILRYLNRLSSLLFVLARYEDHRAGVTQTLARM